MVKKILILSSIFFTVTAFRGISQSEECIFQLQEAERLYSIGQVENIPQMLESCIAEGFNKEERLQAYKLIILTFLTDDNMHNADSAMLDFLKRYPEYEITPADPAEFVYLKNSYKTTPTFSLGVVGGTNLSFPYSIEQFGVHNLGSGSGEFKISSPGFQAGASVIKYLSPRFDLNLEILYQQSVYSYSLVPQQQTSIFNPNYEVEIIETMSLLSFPFSFTVDLTRGKWRPFLRAGIVGTYNLGSTIDPKRYYSDGSLDEVSGQNIATSELNNRTEVNFYGQAGAGLKFDYQGKGYFLFDVRFLAGFTKIVNVENRLDPHSDLIFRYKYTDDDLYINTLFISLGWIYPIYVSEKQPIFN